MNSRYAPFRVASASSATTTVQTARIVVAATNASSSTPHTPGRYPKGDTGIIERLKARNKTREIANK